MKKITLTLLCAALLAGCISQNPYVPIRYYQLDESPLAAQPRQAPLNAGIAVMEIRARPRHDVKMLHRDASGEITYSEYDRWVESPSEMVTRLLMRALAESNAFAHVGPARSLRSADYKVDGDMAAFDRVAEGGACRADFAVRLEVSRADDSEVIWSDTVEISKAMPSDTGASLAAAMSAAAREAVESAAGKIADAVERDLQRNNS